mmetsp:Transcript_10613/g.17328  ORF Transcript_10613/g.17328 Transcript_10613/m.17328 type:complete len:299 (+) Transcript_10613:207-1103(+)
MQAALGCLPREPTLRRCVSLDESGSFFRSVSSVNEQVGSKETVQEYIGNAQSHLGSRTVSVVPIGSVDGDELQRLVDFASVFLYPGGDVRVDKVSSLEASRLRLFKDPRDPGKLDCAQILTALERNMPQGAGSVIGVCFVNETNARAPFCRSQSCGLLSFRGVGTRQALEESAGQIMRMIINVASCGYFTCALNPVHQSGDIFALCPICLRKLSLACAETGGFDCVERYIKLFKFYNEHSMFRQEAQWTAERLAFLGRYEFEDKVRPQPQPSAPSEQEKMKANLSILKSKMKKGPVFG